MTSYYFEGRNFRQQKFSQIILFWLAGPKTLNFAKFVFIIGPFVINFTKFIFVMTKF